MNKSYYVLMLDNLRKDNRICANAKMLYGSILSLSKKNGYCYATNKFLAEQHNATKRSVIRWIKSLEENGYIKTQLILNENTKDVSKREIYILSSEPKKDENVVKDNELSSENNILTNDKFEAHKEEKSVLKGGDNTDNIGAKIEPKITRFVTRGGDNSCTEVATERTPIYSNIYNKIYNININPLTPFKEKGGDAEEYFQKFWVAYPKKIGKAKAKKIFKKLKMTDDLLDKIINALTKQKQSKQWLKENGEYIPHPSTWLNQERWEDVIEGEMKGEKSKRDDDKVASKCKYGLTV